MPHVTEHTPKVSTRSVKSYACESSREKRQQDRQTDRHTDGLSKNHFSRRFGGCTSQVRSYLEVDFLHDANTSIDIEVKTHAQLISDSTFKFHLKEPFHPISYVSISKNINALKAIFLQSSNERWSGRWIFIPRKIMLAPLLGLAGCVVPGHHKHSDQVRPRSTCGAGDSF